MIAYAATAADPNTVVLAGEVLDWLDTKTGQVRTLILTIASLMAVIAVLTAWWRTRSWVGTLVAVVLSAGVLWGISEMDALSDRVGSEFEDEPV